MYKIVVTKSAQKKLDKLPAKEKIKITIKIDTLAGDSRPHGSKKLTGRPGYRIRIGNYRVIYHIEDNVLTVLILDIDHRKQVYD